jgi:signal transduction histidine kinase
MELARGADPTWMRLDVSDDGKGISDPLLRHLGETLLLSSATHRQEFFVKGNGLGFTICRRIAAQHGGRILVSSGPRGTRVRVWLRTHESGPRRKVDLAPLETEFLP